MADSSLFPSVSSIYCTYAKGYDVVATRANRNCSEKNSSKGVRFANARNLVRSLRFPSKFQHNELYLSVYSRFKFVPCILWSC